MARAKLGAESRDRTAHGLTPESVKRMGAVWEAVRAAALGGLLADVASRCDVEPGALLFAQTERATSARLQFVEAAHLRGWSYSDVCAVLRLDRSGVSRMLRARKAGGGERTGSNG